MPAQTHASRSAGACRGSGVDIHTGHTVSETTKIQSGEAPF